MLDRRRRLAARFFAIGLLAAMLFTVDSLSLPSPAEARCTGVNNPVRSTFSYGGGVAVSETPVSGTCNGNQLYTAILKDERADGYCVFVEFMEAGGGWTIPDDGAVCYEGNTARFEWRDSNNNSRVYEHLCLLRDGPPYDIHCGWGTREGDYGTNWGY